MSKEIMATFIPEAWMNNYAIEVDGRREFDVTALILAMPIEHVRKLEDDTYESDRLARNAGLLDEHTGPFVVEIEASLEEYFGTEERKDWEFPDREDFSLNDS